MTDDAPINPYEPPAFAPAQPSRPRGAIGPPLPWSATEAVGLGWERVKRWPLVVVMMFAVSLIGAIPDLIGGVAQVVLMATREEALIVVGVAVRVVFALAGAVFGVWLTLGKTRVLLKFARAIPAEFGELFAGGPFLSMLGAAFLLGAVFLAAAAVVMMPGLVLMAAMDQEDAGVVALVLGLLVLMVPLLVVGLRVQFFPWLIVDRGAHAIDSLKQSWEITRGQFGGLFVFLLLTILIVVGALMAGLLACLVGVIVTLPVAITVVWLAQTCIYLKLTGEDPDAPAP